MVYTEQQLKEFAKNSELFQGLRDVLKALNEEADGLRVKDIGDKIMKGTYPRDKAIIALEFSGFISKREASVAKIYTITGQGKKLLYEILNKE